MVISATDKTNARGLRATLGATPDRQMAPMVAARRPTPLSTVIHRTRHRVKVVTQATLIGAVLDKVDEMRAFETTAGAEADDETAPGCVAASCGESVASPRCFADFFSGVDSLVDRRNRFASRFWIFPQRLISDHVSAKACNLSVAIPLTR